MLENRGNEAVTKAFSPFNLMQTFSLLVVVAFVAGCASTTETGERDSGNALRVAIAPDYPPLVSEQGKSFVGAEIDMARALGQELNRPVSFVTIKREELITALQDGRADIVMSGMSVTKARQLRAAFTSPYLQNQLRAVFRRADADRYRSVADIQSSTSRIGVLPGTTADVYVQTNCREAQRVPLQYRRYAVFYLTDGGQIDIYVDDIFALAQLVSQNEAALAYLKEPLAVEDIAWAVAPSNQELLQQVNEILARWKSDGSLDRMLQKWMPYLKSN